MFKCKCSTDDDCTVYDSRMMCDSGQQCVCLTGWIYNALNNICVLGKQSIPTQVTFM